tara:strand:+ start:1201 stop:1974 length:774 start_codon:yes stop_codon:yes gene_type:complete
MHEASNIKKANPANFEFTIPALTQNALDVVFNLLVDYKTGTNTLNTFDLYIKLPNDVYKLEKCVITNGTFLIEKLENLKLAISGEASTLTGGATLPTTDTDPAVTVVAPGTRTYQQVNYLQLKADNTNLTEGIYKVSVELQNDIEWLKYETVNDALAVTTADNSMYPSDFTLKKRILSGSIGQYVLSNFNSDVQSWKTGVDMVIKAGESATQGFQFDLEKCTFTNRNSVSEVFTQSYDWKMNDNVANLGDKIKFNAI